MPKALDASDIKALIQAGIDDSESFVGSDLSEDRTKLLDYYYGRKTGILSAEDGHSQVVDRAVLETVEWGTAQVLRLFTGSEYVVFDPEDQDDVKAAEQETDYVNYVIQRQNSGFRLLHDAIKDGLLSRIGIVHVQIDDTPKQRIEAYTEQTPEQVQMLLAEPNTELLEKTERTIKIVGDDGQTQEIPVWDCRIKYSDPQKKIKICGVAPEEFGVNRQARSLEDAELVWHKYKFSIAYLRKLGATDEQLEAVKNEVRDNPGLTDEPQARDNETATQTLGEDERTKVWAYRVYLWADFDGDGQEELRQFYYCGKQVIGEETGESAEEIPYATWCPVPMPHRFYGLGYGDLAVDTQEIKTHLKRGGLENLYASNEPMMAVPESEGPNALKDLLSRRIGGVVRTKNPGSITPIVVPNMLAPTLQAIEYEDTVRDSRTGLARFNPGLDPRSLNTKTATEVSAMETQGQLRVELVARLFAEELLVRLYRLVHAFCRRHQDIAQTVRLRNNFVTVRPTEWRDRSNLKVSVGLGNGTREQMLAATQQIIGLQIQGLQIGIATPQHIYNAAAKMADLLGFKDSQNYFQSPPPPDPNAQMQHAQQQAQLQAYVEGAKEQAKAQGRAQGEQMKAQMQYQQKLMEISQREAAEGRSLDLERQKAQADYAVEVAKLQQADRHKALDFAANVITHTHDKQVEREAMQRAK